MTQSLTLDTSPPTTARPRCSKTCRSTSAEGELVSLLGASGCGKTTTLRLDRRLPAADLGHDHAGRPRPDPPAGAPARHRPGVPELRAVPASVGRRQCRLRPEAARHIAAPSASQARRRDARARRARATRRPPARRAVRRPEAARGAGARAGHRAAAADVRRAAVATSTPSCASTCASRSASCSAPMAPPRSMSRTTRRRRSRSPTASPSCMQGRIMQLDTPETLYQRPANAFVARFVGFENLIPMKVVVARRRQGHRGSAGRRAADPAARTRSAPSPTASSSPAAPMACRSPTIRRCRRHPRHAWPAHLSRPRLSVPVRDAGRRAGRQWPAVPPARAGAPAKLVPVPEQCTILAAGMTTLL